MTPNLIPEEPWTAFREQMPCSHRWAYFDHAAVAPISGPARDAMMKYAQESAVEGETAWTTWSERRQQIRKTAAELFGASPEEIGFVVNTTHGISLIAEGLPWQDGDNVVTLSDEFPSNQYPWLNLASRGVKTRRVATRGGSVDLNALADACDERTRVVSISWVGYASGWRNDLDSLANMAHDRGALMFVDAIQALGVFPIDLSRTKIDFFAADGHKWLLGPEGAGLFYVRREHLDRLRPWGVGWNSVEHDHDFAKIELRLKKSVERFEGGSANLPGILALGASLDLLGQIGIERIAERILDCNEQICAQLDQLGAKIISPRDRVHTSGIISFELPGSDPRQVVRHCRQKGVIINTRGGRLRVSPHAYNDQTDIDRLRSALGEASSMS